MLTPSFCRVAVLAATTHQLCSIWHPHEVMVGEGSKYNEIAVEEDNDDEDDKNDE